MKNIIKQKPLLMYFIMTFIFSWSGILITSIFMGMPTTSTLFAEKGPVALIPLLLGPTIIGLLLTGLTKGKTGLIDLKKRLLKWKVNIKWYAFAILTLPVFLSVMLLILSQFSSDFIPKVFNEKNKLSFIVTGILTGLIGGGLFEEIGWTGFATPEFRSRYSILKTGLILGFLWGVWHFLPVFWGSGDINGNIEWSGFLPGLFCHYAVLIPYRIIMVWLHDNTGSMMPVILMHASLTTFANFILNISEGGLSLFIYYVILAVFLWIIVGIISKSLNRNHQIK